MTLEKISDKLFQSKKIAIFTHINPDCDGFGSMFSLYYGLKSLGKKCSMFVDGSLGKFESEIFECEKIDKEFKPEKFDTIIAVDCAELSRLGKYAENFKKHLNSFKIDHHFNTDNYAINSYVEHDSASCCEIVYELLTKLQVEFNKKIATSIYAGIATDTGSFMNTNTTTRSMKIAEKMLTKGADTILINKQCFRMISKESIELTKMLYNNIKYAQNGEVAYVIFNKKDFAKTKTAYQDASNFSNILCSIDGVKIGCCITERDGFSFSIRSVMSHSAKKLAILLGGGGHEQAAGAIIKEKQKVVEKKFLEAVKKYFSEIK
jgi:phosphoesterase RecJ-like protein